MIDALGEMRFLILILLLSTAVAEEVPAWVLRGLLAVESSSSYLPDGSIRYVDRRRGKADERGPFQVTPSTFRLYAKAGERIEWLEEDTAFAERFTRRILVRIYQRQRSWSRALSVYNTGRVCSRGNIYAEEIGKKGKR